MVGSRQTPLAFQDASELGDWLAAHHPSARELWVRIFKASADTRSITWNDCVVEAIRFGWIDGQKQPFDADSFLQRLTPRKSKSNWSAKNCAHATALIAESRMAPAGLAQVEAAKADGRWDKASAGSATMTIPQDFLDCAESEGILPDPRPKESLFDLLSSSHGKKAGNESQAFHQDTRTVGAR